ARARHPPAPAWQDRDVEPLIGVEALVLGREVARELRLWEPLELEPDRLHLGRRARARRLARGRNARRFTGRSRRRGTTSAGRRWHTPLDRRAHRQSL